MQIECSRSGKTRVLAVDDEPVARQQLAFQLVALGHEVTTAGNFHEAHEILLREGSACFDCLITDCWMPGKTGLDLLLWLRDYDPTLATIVISKAADKELITQTLRGGASDFLEKPVFRDELAAALEKTIHSTQRRRSHAATNLAVKEAGLVQRHMNNLGIARALQVSLTVCYYPRHDAGGDSVAFFSPDPGRILIVVADVSGHEIKSAFISAYFQGMLRAMVERETPIGAILDRFNGFLIREWSLPDLDSNEPASSEITSLSVCSASIDLAGGSANFLNSGFPIPHRVDRHGAPFPCGEAGGHPLGWFDPNPIAELAVAIDREDRLVIWTDGLEDFANQLDVDEWSLAFRILQTKQERLTPAWLANAPDDVLLLVVGMAKELPETWPFPILTASYEKLQTEDIDQLQGRWRRSLEFAFPELSEDRLSEILLCTREAVLNGLIHGCSKTSDRCRLTMIFDAGPNHLLVDVADPGPGHHSDPWANASGELLEGHRGLLLIHGLPHRVEVTASGAALRLVFVVEKDSTGKKIS